MTGKPSSILVVEDSPINQQILRNLLTKEGYETHREKVTLAAVGDGDARRGESKTLEIALKKGSVTVVLEVEPPPQAVFVDGKPWTGDPKSIEGLSAGEEHKIAVSSSGYVAKTFTVESAGEVTIAFIAAAGQTPSPAQAPLVNAITVICK